MMSLTRRPRCAPRRLLAALLLGAIALTGCSTLPDSGPVHTRLPHASDGNQAPPYFTPPGPRRGDSRQQIVNGYLTAMQANPPSTAVARTFLTATARDTWTPNQGVILYDAHSARQRGDGVDLRLSDVQRLDERGSWVGGPPGQGSDLHFRLTREDGEWRIMNPPDALVVPMSYFSGLYVPYNLYFPDQTREVLVADQIYLPAGEQMPTNLVRSLLLGPGPGVDQVTSTAFPPRTALDVGVVVTDSGVAEVPMSSSILKLSREEMSWAVAQLAQTLRQVAGITRLRLTVDGAPVPLPGGRSDVSLDEGSELFAVLHVGNPAPVGLRAGRVVRISGDTTEPVAGPFGRPGYALRSIAADDEDQLFAGVTGNGRQVFLAPSQSNGVSVRSVLKNGRDLLRPVFDNFGTLWLVDRTARGARIFVVEKTAHGPRTRSVPVPGITGKAVSAFTLTGDGTRLVATLARGQNPVVLVGQLVRGSRGRVLSVKGVHTIRTAGEDLGPGRDVGVVDENTVAVLTRPAGPSDQVVFVQLDGSPGGPNTNLPDVVPARVDALVAGPFDRMPLRVVTTDQRLLRLNESGEWIRNKADQVTAAAYPR